MYVDPEGNFTILGILISIGFSLLFEVIEDAIDGGLGDGSHDWRDYLGAAVSGLFGGLSPFGGTLAKKICSQVLFSFVGGVADAAISGDLQENGFWSTMGNIAVSTIVSIVVGELGDIVASKIKANSLIKMRNKNKANQILKKMGAVGKMGKKTNAQLSKNIRNSNWIGNTIVKNSLSSIMWGVSAIGWGHMVNGV